MPVLVAVRERRAGDEPEEGSEEQAEDHRPYVRSIWARICAIELPAFARRDASSASSMHTSQVAAWPSV
jgi:hypothetical protein